MKRAPACCADEAGTVTLAIEDLAHGPDAVARHQGRVIFVRGAAPGDVVRARLVGDRDAYAHAEIVHRCVAGPAHREPPCPWVAACGGCPWQHVRYPAQAAAKERNVRETLARIAGIVPTELLPILAAPDELAYRHRIRLHAERGRLGYLRPRSHQIVEIEHCAIALPELSAVLPAVRRLVRRLATRVETVDLVANGRGGVVVVLRARRWRPADEPVLAALVRTESLVTGIRADDRRGSHVVGDPTVVVEGPPGTPPRRQRAGSFTQVNPTANRLLIATVLAFAPPAHRVLDLFCGAGNLSLPLAAAGIVTTGVDRESQAIDDARAAAAGLPGVRFEALAAERFLAREGTAGADLVLLDPPRGGAARAVAQLGRLRPPRILYVSCNPATLARDTRTLAAAGYGVTRVQPLDLFPQTPHVETVLEFVLTAA